MLEKRCNGVLVLSLSEEDFGHPVSMKELFSKFFAVDREKMLVVDLSENKNMDSLSQDLKEVLLQKHCGAIIAGNGG